MQQNQPNPALTPGHPVFEPKLSGPSEAPNAPSELETQDRCSSIFRIDRRREARRGVDGPAVAVFSSGHDAARLFPVDLIDASPHGVGVLSPTAVELGATVCLYPSDVAGRPSMDTRRIGLVVRCVPKAEGYVLGVRCAAARVAA